MGRGFKPLHPVKLRGVVASAVLDRGLSVPAALRLLAEGKLPGWPGRYDLPSSSASGYVKAERDRRRSLQLKRADPSTVQTEVAGQVALLLAELERRARAVDAKTSTDDIRDLARAQRELLATARACSAQPGQRTPDQPEGEGNTATTEPEPDLIAQLANTDNGSQPG